MDILTSKIKTAATTIEPSQKPSQHHVHHITKPEDTAMVLHSFQKEHYFTRNFSVMQV